jgi:ubiquinone/menaquinone biosynthesis C-methylase UbiE
MLERRLEPEVMDTPEDARDYDAMDHSTVNRVFVDDFLAVASAQGLAVQTVPQSILDVGTGTALIPIELCRRQWQCHVTAVDLAAEMLKLAEINITQARLPSQIRIEQIDAKQMPYRHEAFDAVISNSIVHHIPDPSSVVSEMIRVLRDRGVLFIRDLLRPNSIAEINHLVTTYAGGENAHSQQLFRDSLHAALSLNEVRQLAAANGIAPAAVQQTSDRHWTLAWPKDAALLAACVDAESR